MKDKLLEIINHYGVNHQQRKLNEEVFELQEAIINCEMELDSEEPKLGYNDHKNHITEEIADVMVLLEQFKVYYGISSEEVTKIFWSKVDRQLERIKEESECIE